MTTSFKKRISLRTVNLKEKLNLHTLCTFTFKNPFPKLIYNQSEYYFSSLES